MRRQTKRLKARRWRYVLASRRVTVPLKHLETVSVESLPPKIQITKFGNIIARVYELPKGQGLRLTAQHSKRDATHRAMGIVARGRDCGKPVSCRVRFCDANTSRAGWRVFVFKRTDFIKRAKMAVA